MYCFDKSRRLLNKSDYDCVFNESRKIITPNFVVLYKKNVLGHARLGLALSKKSISKAHDRNRVKRLLRETFRTASLPAFDIIILAKLGAFKRQHSLTVAKLGELWDNLCEK